MNRVRFDGETRPDASATHVMAVGRAAPISMVRTGVFRVERDATMRRSAATAAPTYKPRHRAHTGNCAAAV